MEDVKIESNSLAIEKRMTSDSKMMRNQVERGSLTTIILPAVFVIIVKVKRWKPRRDEDDCCHFKPFFGTHKVFKDEGNVFLKRVNRKTPQPEHLSRCVVKSVAHYPLMMGTIRHIISSE